ncbi:hypothetical protein ABZ805_17875 [Saccharopolyspora sp. NPDC047091]|uniref:hypothetical protein n=1 Tax=Saccharopolyspora sp. NPDC047091 TaxID=3155924 RepID=UPI0033E57209
MPELLPTDPNSAFPPSRRPGLLSRPGSTGYVLHLTGHLQADTTPDRTIALYERVLHGLEEL